MKFTIRDLFLTTAIVAVCTAWVIDHRRQAKEVDELKEQLEQQVKQALERARSY